MTNTYVCFLSLIIFASVTIKESIELTKTASAEMTEAVLACTG
jgi:hypothetical protein